MSGCGERCRLALATIDEWFDLDRAQIEAYEAEAAEGLKAVMTSPASAAPIEAAMPEDETMDTSSGGRELIAQLLSDQPSAGVVTQVDEERRVVPPRVILCEYCHQEVADMECPECEAVYCDDCHRVLHFNRKRRNHKATTSPHTAAECHFTVQNPADYEGAPVGLRVPG